MYIVIILCVALVLLVAAVAVMYISQQKKMMYMTLERQAEVHKQELERNREYNNLQNKQLLAELKIISRELASEQSEKLRNENEREIKNIVEPLRMHLESFKQQIDAGNDRENRARANLQGQIEQLITLNHSLGDDTRELTQALRGDGRIQGEWGEIQLITLLEQNGLQRDVHFSTQVTRGDDGRVLKDNVTDTLRRPDVVLSLPGKRKLIIDSKVSLTAYLDYTAASDKKVRQDAAKRHLTSVKQHINDLEKKNYPALITGSVEQTIMFMPVENAFMLAVHTDPGLIQYASERHVVIVTPVHLISVVQLVAQLWRQEDSDRNAQEIAQAAGNLYDKLCGFCDDFEKVRRSLETASSAWDSAHRKLSSGRGNAISQAEKMKSMGAKSTRRLLYTPEDEV